jgi:hypothetical protein
VAPNHFGCLRSSPPFFHKSFFPFFIFNFFVLFNLFLFIFFYFYPPSHAPYSSSLLDKTKSLAILLVKKKGKKLSQFVAVLMDGQHQHHHQSGMVTDSSSVSTRLAGRRS